MELLAEEAQQEACNSSWRGEERLLGRENAWSRFEGWINIEQGVQGWKNIPNWNNSKCKVQRGEEQISLGVFCWLEVSMYLGMCMEMNSILAWKIPWTEESGGLQSMRSLRVGHDWVTSLSCIGEGNGNPLQCSCLEPGGLPSMGSHRVGHDWSDYAAAALAVWRWSWKMKVELDYIVWKKFIPYCFPDFSIITLAIANRIT